jgi:hypothetical protein
VKGRVDWVVPATVVLVVTWIPPTSTRAVVAVVPPVVGVGVVEELLVLLEDEELEDELEEELEDEFEDEFEDELEVLLVKQNVTCHTSLGRVMVEPSPVAQEPL